MAQSKNNVITHGLSGKVGDLIVFSQRGKKTVVSTAPRKSTNTETDKQRQHKEKFQKAVLYAKTALQDATLKHEYEELAKKKEGIVSAYNVAVADLLNAPKIEQIDLSQYTGKMGDTISVLATDDFKVTAVKVSIHNADGTLVEEGDATEVSGFWVYTATANNTDLSGDKIVITATDTPKNKTEKEETI